MTAATFVRTAALLLLIAPFAVAAQPGPADQESSLQVLVDQQQKLRRQIDEGVDGLTPRQARVIRQAQDEFFGIVADRSALDELSIADKVRVENALETINAQIVNTPASLSDQEVCWREAKFGSRQMVTRCGTRTEIEQTREGARDYLSRPRICSGPGCG